MATNSHNWTFKDRVKRMLAEKIDGDQKNFSKCRKKIIHNYNIGKMSVGVLKPEEVIIKEDRKSNAVINGDTEQRKKMKSEQKEKKNNEIHLENNLKQLNNDSFEIISKQNVRDKRQRIEMAKSRRQDRNSKKRKTNLKDKRIQRKKSIPMNSSLLVDEFDYNDDSDELSLEDNDKKEKEVKTTFVGKIRKFGEPMVIEGPPKSVQKLRLFGTPVSNLNTTSISSNYRGNILSTFCSDDENPNLAIFKNASMTGNAIDDCEIEETNNTNKSSIELPQENVENPNYDSDISFISNDDRSDTNLSSDKITNEFNPEQSVLGDSVELDNDSREKPEFYSLHNKVVAIMGPSCKFYFNGKLRVKVLIGRVEIYGFIFSQFETVLPAEIYSPRGSSLVSIETVNCESEDNDTSESLYGLIINEGINKGVATELQNKLNELPEGQAVLILENIENTLTKYLDVYYPFKLFPKTEDPSNYHNRHPRKAEKLLQAIIQCDDLGKQLKKDHYRESEILDKFSNTSNQNDYQRILIAGGKGVGKSTTLRYFINRLLPTRREIVVIDFDPGQPEFTPSGCISLNIINRPLTGPNYTHLKTPFYQIFIGDVNVARCIPRYVQAAKTLVKYLNESPRLRGRTVLINTMGFCIGVGWDLMVYIIKLIHPSTVVQITSERSKNNFQYLLTSEVINDQSPTHFTGGESESSIWETPCDHELHVLPSLAEGKGKSGDFWDMEPRQQREITLLAYLSEIPKEDDEDDKILFSPLLRINDTIPYSVPMVELTISLIRTIVPASHILATMNGNIVALCGIDVNEENSDSAVSADRYPKTLLRAPISPCYGFGIVRGVDMENGNIFINTPLTLNELKYVNSLIGSIPLPTSLISSDRRNTPYIGEGADLPTSREPRRGYFRMRQRYN